MVVVKQSCMANCFQDLNELSGLTAKVRMSTEVRAYLHNIVVFMRLHRAVGGGISAMATRHFGVLAQLVRPINQCQAWLTLPAHLHPCTGFRTSRRL